MSTSSKNGLSHTLSTGARIVLGLIFTVFGLNGFLQFLPAPSVEGAALTFLGGLASAGYFFPLLKGTEIVAGLALLTGRFVPLALVVLAPITIQIAAFHLGLAPEGSGLAAAILVLHLGLGWVYRSAFRPLFAIRTSSADPLPILGGSQAAHR